MADNALVLLILTLLGTFAFALNGGLTAIRAVRVHIVGVVALGVVTAVGGGILRDLMLGAVPPATFNDWRYLATATAGALIAFFFSRRLTRIEPATKILDAAGLALLAVTGTSKALTYGAGPVQAVLLGALTGVGGGTLRDVLIQRVPSVLSSGLYAIPALLGATIVALAAEAGMYRRFDLPVDLLAAVLAFALRLIGLHFDIKLPSSRSAESTEVPASERATDVQG